MTTTELINNANLKKAKIELHDDFIGVKFNGKRNHTYYWFIIINDNVYFDHSYNQNTGRTIKSSIGKNSAALFKIGYFN